MKNILWVPLDLPPIKKEVTLENIGALFDYVPNASPEERIVLSKQRQHYKYAWNTFRLRYPSSTRTDWEGQNLDDCWDWTDGAQKHCPNLVEYIVTQLPFKKLKAVSIMSSTGVVPLHLDMPLNATDSEKKNYVENEPSVYRLLIDGDMHKDSFYVASKSVGKRYVSLPASSPGWAMGCYSCGHGNDETVPHQKLLVYLMGDLDQNRHAELLNRSILKYKDFAILSAEQI